MLTEMASPGRQPCQSVGPASVQAEGRALNDSCSFLKSTWGPVEASLQ